MMRPRSPASGHAPRAAHRLPGLRCAATTLATAALAASVCACAGARHADAGALKPAVEALHTALRWRDFGAAAELVVPERRAAFLRARERAHDERDLAFSELASDTATVDPAAGTATVRARMSWVRLPSASERSALVAASWVWRLGRWWLERLDGGPFPELEPSGDEGRPERHAPLEPAIQTPTDSGPAEAVGGGGPPMGLPD